MTPGRVLLIHTAFIGDVILVLPLVQAVRRAFPAAELTVMAVPASAPVLENHPDIHSILLYDKRHADRGLAGLWRMTGRVRSEGFDLALVPHRSLRSALIPFLAGVPHRIGFSSSAGRMLLTEHVPYRSDAHEIDRDLDLLIPLRARPEVSLLPAVYPNAGDESVVLQWMAGAGIAGGVRPVAVAPGSVWNTKRWPAGSYEMLCRLLRERGEAVVLVGGKADVPLCESIAASAGVPSAAGVLSLLQSAALLRRCRVLVTNDTAPQHLAVAVRTPVVAIFGPTVPAFGFSPAGPRDAVVETLGLRCRPCSIHGGARCPIGTFVCMNLITPERVLAAIDDVPG